MKISVRQISEKKRRTNAAVIFQMEQIQEWVNYQLNDSTARKLDDGPFPLLYHHEFIKEFMMFMDSWSYMFDYLEVASFIEDSNL